MLSQGNWINTKDILENVSSKIIDRNQWPREIQTLGEKDEFEVSNVPDGRALTKLMDACRRMERDTMSPNTAKDESEGLVTVLLSDGTTRSFRINENNEPTACKNPSWVSFLKVIDYR